MIRRGDIRVSAGASGTKGPEVSIYMGTNKRVRKLVPSQIWSQIKDPQKIKEACERWGFELARKLRLEEIRAHQDEELFTIGPTLHTIHDEWFKWLKARRTENTAINYESSWCNHLSHHPIASRSLTSIKYRHVAELHTWLATRETQVRGGQVKTGLHRRLKIKGSKVIAGSTGNQVKCCLKSMLDYAHKFELIASIPPIEFAKTTRYTRPLEKDQYFTDSQLETILKVASELNTYVYVAILLGADAGLREGEILGLKWSCVNFDTNEILVLRQNTKKSQDVGTKHGSDRAVPMTTRLKEALTSLSRETPYVLQKIQLVHRQGEGIVDHAAMAWWMLCVTKIANEVDPSIEHCASWHKLRHTYATRVSIATHGDIFILMRLLGHKTPNSVAKYVHVRGEAIGSLFDAPGFLKKLRLVSNIKTE